MEQCFNRLKPRVWGVRGLTSGPYFFDTTQLNVCELCLKTPACSSAPRLEIDAASLSPCGSDVPGKSGVARCTDVISNSKFLTQLAL